MTGITPLFIKRYSQLVPHQRRDVFFKALTSTHMPTLRVNTLKCTVADATELLGELGNVLKPCPWFDYGLISEIAQSLTKNPWFFAGLYYLQDLSSMLPVAVLDPQPGETVLDMAAAPGSKTTQMAMMMQNQGLIIANDNNAARLPALAFNLEKYGVVNCAISHREAQTLGRELRGACDRVLLDAPCSAEGAAAKDRDYFKYWHMSKIIKLSHLQRQLLISALECLKPGGTLVYSTCTLAPEENEANIQFLLDTYGDEIDIEPVTGFAHTEPGLTKWQDKIFDPRMSGTLRVFPDAINAEAFFVAKIRKHKSATAWQPAKAEPTYKSSKHSIVSAKTRDTLIQQMQTEFGLEQVPWEDFDIRLNRETYWLTPRALAARFPDLSVDRSGLPFGRITRNGFKQGFEFALTYGHLAKEKVYPMSTEQAHDWIRGKDLTDVNLGSLSHGLLLPTYRGYAMGCGLGQENRIKNQTKKAFVQMY